MKKWKLLPRMAAKGIMSNEIVYYPYMIAGIFAVFAYFVFASILNNDIVKTLPHAAYAYMMLHIGKVLLIIILFFFLLYAGGFVIKRRKKEIGLYSLLGLEKKHIGLMLFLETLILYGIVIAGGMILGLVLTKLFFLFLLKLNHLPMDIEFVFTAEAVQETAMYFGVIFFIYFLHQLWEVGKSRPKDLLAGSKKGEKEPRLLGLWAIIGAIVLGLGYYFSIGSQVDSMIFNNFFGAVLLVVIGTYFLFTSGSVFFLKLMRRNRNIYYKPANFITISGMYYRMKKNAAGLANICIFSTMVMITLICTVYVYLGQEDMAHFMYPYDIEADYEEGSLTTELVKANLSRLEEKYGLKVQRADLFAPISLFCSKTENRFEQEEKGLSDEDIYSVILLTLGDYNHIADAKEELSEQEVLVYSTGSDFGYDTLEFMGITCNMKKEIQELFPYPKAGQDSFGMDYLVIVRDRTVRDAFVRAWAEPNGVEDMDAFLKSGGQKLGIFLEGDEEDKTAFVNELAIWCQGQPGFKAYKDGLVQREENRAMYGGLLFIGVIFGLIFFLCLIIIMYYKQVSEGYEDQTGFDIMQKVGMSDDEIKHTIHRQILLVFGLPLVGALAHTAAGMFMVDRLMVILGFVDIRLLIGCTIGIFTIFIFVYAVSYTITAKTYYRIVRHSF